MYKTGGKKRRSLVKQDTGRTFIEKSIKVNKLFK